MAGLPATELILPIGAGEFSALMARHAPWPADTAQSPIALAVSGGADSLALALLTARWRRHVIALVVDHGLRAESAAEAELTADWLRHRGIAVRVLTLSGLSGQRLQERARQGRYEALIAACHRLGCADLLVGHHAADQEETVSMRLASESGVTGLAGMASESFRSGIRVVRPLLGIHPDRLRATLRDFGQTWIEDPSNNNRRFQRVRLRQDLTEAERGQVRAIRARAAQERHRTNSERAALLAEHAEWYPLGWAGLSREGMTPDLVAALIRVVGGAAYRPPLENIRQLIARGGGTLGGVLVRPGGRWATGMIFCREERGCDGVAQAARGTVWDGRWQLLQDYEGDIRRLGRAADVLDHRGLGCPAIVLRTLPGVWREGRPVLYPDLIAPQSEAPFVWSGGSPVTERDVFCE